jgi:probable HAF family extracellular repeat protein
MQKRLLLICLAGWMHVCDSAPALAAPTIQSLGAPAGFNDFTPTDVNSDGSVIVGLSEIPGDAFSYSARGFRWTAAGFQDLGSLGGDSVRPTRISAHGDVVVGLANLVPGSVEFRIFRWTAATGIQDLGATFFAAPPSVSSDGTTIAAYLASSGPVRWTAAQGFTPISVPSVADPYDISGNGSVVVANDLGTVYTAYRWTAIGGAVALQGLGGCGSDRIANSISSSGAVTVGYSSYRSPASRPGECPPEAVLWNGTAIRALGFLANGVRSVARDVSVDGSVVVGWSSTTGNVVDAFIWKSATNKMQDLNQLLAGALGASSFSVYDAIAVSGDGNVIAAIALNKNTGTFESVRIVLGGATTCVPTSCGALGKNCGSIADGCGGTLACGTCTAPQTCGGSGTPNVCGGSVAPQTTTSTTVPPTTTTVPPTTRQLTLSASGRSGETVSSTPSGLSVGVGTTGAAPFASGTSITLRVSNDRDAIWSGACSSNGSKAKSCTFTLNANASETVNVQ